MSIIVYNHLPGNTRYSTIYQRKHEIITWNLTIPFSKYKFKDRKNSISSFLNSLLTLKIEISNLK